MLSRISLPISAFLHQKLSLLTQQAEVNYYFIKGQGFPNFDPPQFLRNYLAESSQVGNLQYTPTAGAQILLEEVSSFLEPHLNRKYNPKTEIVISPGATTTLTCVFQAYINPGDEAIIIDPSFDYYRPQIEFAGGRCVGVPLIPSQSQTKEEIQKRGPNYIYDLKKDSWDIDWNKLEKSLNQKTKLIVINSPHNPTGKQIDSFYFYFSRIFSQEEYDRLAQLLQKWPNIIIVEDVAYQHIAFAPYKPFVIPQALKMPSLMNRTIGVWSAGKIFSSTGLRIGWAIGNEELIRGVKAANQYHVYCLNEPFQIGVAKSLKSNSQNSYFEETVSLYQNQCNFLMKSLLASKLNLKFWVPQGGYFVLTDISDINVPEMYFQENDGSRRSKDFAFCHWVCYKYGVVAIPITTFYSKQDRHLGENLIRWAFCKKTVDIDEAAKRLQQ